MRQLWNAGVVVLLAGLQAPWVLGCDSENQPCTSCPAIAGGWLVTSEQVDNPCPRAVVPAENVTVEQQGARLNVTATALELRGNLYDTYELSVSGDDAIVPTGTVQLRARLAVGSDAGPDMISGTWSWLSAADDQGQSCRSSWPIKAVRE